MALYKTAGVIDKNKIKIILILFLLRLHGMHKGYNYFIFSDSKKRATKINFKPGQLY